MHELVCPIFVFIFKMLAKTERKYGFPPASFLTTGAYVCFARIRVRGAARIRFPGSVNRFGPSFLVSDWCSSVWELCLHLGQEKRDLRLRPAAAGEPVSP